MGSLASDMLRQAQNQAANIRQQATNERLHDQISALSDESTLADKWEGMGSLASDMLRQAQNQAANIRQKAQDAAEAREAEAAKKASDIIETATNIKLESEAKAESQRHHRNGDEHQARIRGKGT